MPVASTYIEVDLHITLVLRTLILIRYYEG
jgi:hypothetical protein